MDVPMRTETAESDDELLGELGINLASLGEALNKIRNEKKTHVTLQKASKISASYEEAIDKMLATLKYLKSELDEERRYKQETDTRLQLLVSNFERLVNNSNGDVVFDVDGTQIYAHSQIVCLWSVPFAAMLSSGMRESVSKRIVIDTEDANSVREMIRYFYTAQANINAATAVPLLRLSSMYQIDSLRDQTCVYLQGNIDAENCIPLFHIANLHRFERVVVWKDLYDSCLRYIRTHHSAVLSSTISPLKGLDLPLVVKILREITQVQAPVVVRAINTRNLGRAIVNWASDNWPIYDMPELLTFINSEVARNKIQVFVKTSKNTLVILTNSNKNVSELKHVIEGKEAIPIPFQLLLFNGKVLRDDASLHECGIQNDSTIQLCIRSNLSMGPTTTGIVGHGQQASVRLEEGRSDLWKSLYDFCLTAVVADFEEQYKSGGFLKLDVGTLTHILQQDDLAVSHERVVLDALVSWLEARPDVRNDPHVLARLLPLVRFPYIDTQSLLNVPITHPIITSCPVFKTLLQEALHFQISQHYPNRKMPRNNLINLASPQLNESQQPPHSRAKRPLQASSHDDVEMTYNNNSNNNNNSRTKQRKLYEEVPTVNLEQFFSYVVSTVVPPTTR